MSKVQVSPIRRCSIAASASSDNSSDVTIQSATSEPPCTSQDELETELSDETLYELAMRHLLSSCVEISLLDGLLHANHRADNDAANDPIASYIARMNGLAALTSHTFRRVHFVGTFDLPSANRLASLFDRITMRASSCSRTPAHAKLRELSLERVARANLDSPSTHA
jgi:hypothetical protein